VATARVPHKALGSTVAVTVIALVATLLSPLPFPALAAATPLPVPVPPIVSSPIVADPPSIPSGTFDTPVAPAPTTPAAPSTAPSFDAASAHVTSTDEYSTTSTDKNGVHQTLLSPVPVNVLSGSKWVPARSDLSDDGRSGLVGKLNPLAPQFAPTASDYRLFQVSRNGYSLSFKLLGAAKSGLEHPVIPFINVGADQAKYSSVLPNTDLKYQVKSDKVKESIVLTKVPTAGTAVYRWEINAAGLTPEKNQFGDLDFKAADGVIVFSMPVPAMWDSSGKAGVSESTITNVQYQVTKLGPSTYSLVLTPDQAWLQDAARVYPVTVDPTIGPGADSIHSYKSDGTLNDGSVWIGNTAQNGSCCNWRTVAHYNYEQLFGQQITGAQLNASYANSGTTNCYTGGAYWATAFNYNGVGSYLSSFPVCATGNTTDAGLAQQLATWVNTGATGGNLMLTGGECACYSYKSLNTALAISYVSPPSVTGVTGATPTGNVVGPVMPFMQATGTDPAGAGLSFQYVFTSSTGGASFTSPWTSPGAYQVPSGKLSPGKAYSYTISVKDALVGSPTITSTNALWKFTTNTPAPTPPQAQVYPTDGSIVTSVAQPFTAPNPGTTAVQYQFRVSTGADGNSGQVTMSGWLPTPASGDVAWAPPAGALQDGGTYTVSILTKDSYDSAVNPSWVSHFTVNMRIGASGPSPKDTVGPVTVNLANGNVNLRFSSPTVSTLGGPMGLSFAYNSLIAADKYKGLTGTYFNALNPGQTSTTTFDAAGRTPILVRTDPNISFPWGSGSPAPAVPVDYFLARWTGFVQVPSTGGPYTFGIQSDDGAKLSINGAQIVANWPATAAATSIVWAPPSTGLTSTPTPIQFDYYEATGAAAVTLWVKNASGTPSVVPSDWFTTTYLPMPVGWSSSTAIVGTASVYSLARVTDTSVVLTDVSGTAHTYLKVPGSVGGYTAPQGEYGVLSLDAFGMVTLTGDDGTVYSFNAQGSVSSVTAASDAKKRATPIPSYDPTTGRVTKISDPVSTNGGTPAVYGREVTFSYSDGMPASCPALAGYASPVQAGLLCQITYPGHSTASDTTRLYYQQNLINVTLANPAGSVVTQLGQIRDPGDPVTTFGYDSNGRLSTVRNSVSNDWLTLPGHPASDANATTISYVNGKAATVTLPAPDGLTLAARPQKIYTYDTANNTTYVDVGGLDLSTSTIGHAGKVTYDSGWRTLTSTSGLGVTTTNTWSDKDQLLSTIDSVDHETTTIYDSRTDRPIDSYGPAPTACFGAARTPQSCSAAVAPAHTKTGYDELADPRIGLWATYFNNTSVSGTPVKSSLGVLGGAANGSVNANWGTGSPDPAVSADNFSMRLTGTITFPGPGTYVLKTLSDDGARVWVDDANVVDSWIPQGATTLQGNTAITIAAGDPLTRRIRVEYFEGAVAASIGLYWSVNGATAIIVPGSALHPDGTRGLQVAYYNNPTWSGPPALFSLGILGGSGDGSVNADWGTGSPDPTIAIDSFSLRMTGTITFPGPGTFKLQTLSDDGARAWVNDVNVVDDLAYHGAIALQGNSIITIAAGDPLTRRIRVEYFEGGGPGSVALYWSVNGATAVVVPGSALRPDYGLATSVTTDDSVPTGSGLSASSAPTTTSATGYGITPWLGTPTTSTIDPAGLALTTTVTYEPVATTANSWLRRLNRALPSAAGIPTDGSKTTTSNYYTDAETVTADTCGVPAGTHEYGFLKKVTTPAPDIGPAIVTQYVYDLLGRLAGTIRTGDSDWTCAYFDTRGRISSQTFPDTTLRTVTYGYTADGTATGDPLTTWVADSAIPGAPKATTVSDLLGRTFSSTDVWGTKTTPTYDAAGRILSVSTLPPGASPGSGVVTTYSPDLDGKITVETVGGATLATPAYDNKQRLTSIAYGNGTALTTIGRDATGATSALTWAFPTTVAHPQTATYTTGFETGTDTWATTVGTVATATTTPHAGTQDLTVTTSAATPADQVLASRTITGLTVGRNYTITGWVNNAQIGDSQRITVAGSTPPTYTPLTANTWTQLTAAFTATTATVVIGIQDATAWASSSSALIDDVSLTQDAWTETIAVGTSVADQVVRSQSGRILKDTLTDSTAAVAPTPSTYAYDATGRLITATIPGHTLTYAFAATNTCGANPAAGKDGNRTKFTDVHGTTTTTVSSCYDWADRLTATTVTNPPAGVVDVGLTPFSSTGPLPGLVYDLHGNTTKLGNQTMTYDVSDRHLSTTVVDAAGMSTVSYLRDASGRIVSRTSTPPGGSASTIRYLYAGAALFGTDTGAGTGVEMQLSLPGGVSVRIPAGTPPTPGAASTWSYPNLHGDVILQADATGARVGVLTSYDPFGQPVDPTTGNIGTTTSDQTLPDTAPGSADFGWVGSALKLTEHQGSIATIEMGARQYVPALGRFLSCDPVEGGNSNDYVYPNDPINGFDLSGQFSGMRGDWTTGPIRRGTGKAFAPSATAAPETPSYGRSQPHSPAPPDCGNGACRQFDVVPKVCILACITLNYAHREDGQDLIGFGLGGGPRGDASVSVGSSTGSSTGWTFGGSCSAAAIYGYYVGASGAADIGINNVGPTYLGSSAASGAEWGAGAGCSLQATVLQVAPWPAWH